MGVSATQDSAESEVVHILPKMCPITPSLSEESVRTKLNLQRNASARRNPAFYPLLLPHVTLTMKLPAALVIPGTAGMVRLKQKVRFLELEQPWNAIVELEAVINELRDSRGIPRLAESERSDLAAGVIAALNLAGNEVRQKLETAGKNGQTQSVSLFQYLCSATEPVSISLFLPAVFLNDDPNCEFVDRVEFPLPRDCGDLVETVETVARRLADAVDELRGKNDLPALSPPRKSRLIDETRGVLLFHVGTRGNFDVVGPVGGSAGRSALPLQRPDNRGYHALPDDPEIGASFVAEFGDAVDADASFRGDDAAFAAAFERGFWVGALGRFGPNEGIHG